MAAFPYTKQGMTSKRSPLMGIDVARAINGSARAKSWYTATKCNFEIALPALLQDEVAAIEQFIEDNRAVPVDLHYEGDGKTYFCLITSYDMVPLGGCRFDVRVSMVEI